MVYIALLVWREKPMVDFIAYAIYLGVVLLLVYLILECWRH